MNNPRGGSNANFCWFCSHALVGPGGVPHREPLFFKLVKTQDGHEVRVHSACEVSARAFVTIFTAQPPEGM